MNCIFKHLHFKSFLSENNMSTPNHLKRWSSSWRLLPTSRLTRPRSQITLEVFTGKRFLSVLSLNFTPGLQFSVCILPWSTICVLHWRWTKLYNFKFGAFQNKNRRDRIVSVETVCMEKFQTSKNQNSACIIHNLWSYKLKLIFLTAKKWYSPKYRGHNPLPNPAFSKNCGSFLANNW